MTSYMGLPVKESNKSLFSSETKQQNKISDYLNKKMATENYYVGINRSKISGTEENSNYVTANDDSFLSSHNQCSAETPSPYPCMDIHEDDSISSSKQTSASVSPLVVLPLPTEALSKQCKDYNHPKSQDGNTNQRSENRRRTQHLGQPMSRVNELAEYAKQYEDLYTRRMGTLNCNSSTSGSVPSASGSSNRYQRQSFNNARIRQIAQNEPLNSRQDEMRSPALSTNSSLPMQPVDGNDYGSFSKNHQNVIQWVQNQHTFTSESLITKNNDFSNDSRENGLSWRTEYHDIRLLNSENNLEPGNSDNTVPTSLGESLKYENNSNFHNESPASKQEERGDPNQSGLPNIDVVRRTGGVKSLVSAFNEQIESQKVCYSVYSYVR